MRSGRPARRAARPPRLGGRVRPRARRRPVAGGRAGAAAGPVRGDQAGRHPARPAGPGGGPARGRAAGVQPGRTGRAGPHPARAGGGRAGQGGPRERRGPPGRPGRGARLRRRRRRRRRRCSPRRRARCPVHGVAQRRQRHGGAGPRRWSARSSTCPARACASRRAPAGRRARPTCPGSRPTSRPPRRRGAGGRGRRWPSRWRGCGGRQREGRAALVVPAYFHPAVAPHDWAALAALAGRVRLVVLNVASGPGEQRDPAFTDVLAMLHRGGVDVAGYVDTDYGRRPGDAVESDLARYRCWYPQARAVFFDRVASSRRPGRALRGARRRRADGGPGRRWCSTTACIPIPATPSTPTCWARSRARGRPTGSWRCLAGPARSAAAFLHLVHSVPAGRSRPPGGWWRRATPARRYVTDLPDSGPGGQNPWRRLVTGRREGVARARGLGGRVQHRGRWLRRRTARAPAAVAPAETRARDPVGAAARRDLAVAAHGPDRHEASTPRCSTSTASSRARRRSPRCTGPGARSSATSTWARPRSSGPTTPPSRTPSRADSGGFAGERLLDIRRIDVLAPIMAARFDMCRAQGLRRGRGRPGGRLRPGLRLPPDPGRPADLQPDARRPRPRARVVDRAEERPRPGGRARSTSSTSRSTKSASSTRSATCWPRSSTPARRCSPRSTSSTRPTSVPTPAARASARCANARTSTPGATPAERSRSRSQNAIVCMTTSCEFVSTRPIGRRERRCDVEVVCHRAGTVPVQGSRNGRSGETT